MTAMIFRLIGGLGLFLMGMALLTDGLKAFAGDALRRALIRFTGTPFRAFVSGALVTGVVQSSSATTVTVIGFVSAGLLTFSQAVGVVIGASLGTTATGWIVALLGLKVSVGFYALPLVGVGAFLRMLAHGRWKSLGLAFGGFGLIFVGIETLQAGMAGLSAVLPLARLPAGGLGEHLLAMVIGVAMTLIMQSSSAAVAATMTALHTGALNVEQAAAVVIGAAVGTTVTGALAAIGGCVSAKRTALAHVAFNLATGLIAIVLLPALLWGIGWAQTRLGLEAGAGSLAAFHTVFVSLGALLFMPNVDRFARAIERLVPEKGSELTRHLDLKLLHVPAVALETTRRTLRDIAVEMFALLIQKIETPTRPYEGARLARAGEALERTAELFARIPPVAEDVPISTLRIAQIHAIDHLQRLQERLDPADAPWRALQQDGLRDLTEDARKLLSLATDSLQGRAVGNWLLELERGASDLAQRYRQERPTLLRRSAAGEWEPVHAMETLDAMRWIERVGCHVWRVAHYLAD